MENGRRKNLIRFFYTMAGFVRKIGAVLGWSKNGVKNDPYRKTPVFQPLFITSYYRLEKWHEAAA